MTKHQAYLEHRAKTLAKYIIATNATVRATSKKFNISKSTVHKDVAERLINIDFTLANRVGEVLRLNKAERSKRGGESTKRKRERKVA